MTSLGSVWIVQQVHEVTYSDSYLQGVACSACVMFESFEIASQAGPAPAAACSSAPVLCRVTDAALWAPLDHLHRDYVTLLYSRERALVTAVQCLQREGGRWALQASPGEGQFQPSLCHLPSLPASGQCSFATARFTWCLRVLLLW